MAYYRLYFLDGSSHIEHFREFEAITDAAAVAQSEQWRAANAMELWCERRKVKRWEALASSPEAKARAVLRAIRSNPRCPTGPM
jgi:DNA-binding transcriptional regulator YiaG